ncbi:MAG TPA: hypothetical protein PK867_21560 [Pirellulales bacterium]|nr:hypothetical protein [Pirellulales bacterium]
MPITPLSGVRSSRHIGQEIAFRAAGRHGRFACLLELLRLQSQFGGLLFQSRFCGQQFLIVAFQLGLFGRDLLDLSLQGRKILLGRSGQVGFFRQRPRQLQHFHGVEWFFQDQQVAGVTELGGNLAPIVIGVRRADHALQIRQLFPEGLDGLHSVHARRHADVDERHIVGLTAAGRLDGHSHAVFPLVGGVDLEVEQPLGAGGGRHLVIAAEEIRLQRIDRRMGGCSPQAVEHLAEVGVDVLVVVDDQQPPGGSGRLGLGIHRLHVS